MMSERDTPVLAHDTKHADYLWERDGTVMISLRNGWGHVIIAHLCKKLAGVKVTLVEESFLIEKL